jgi:hypothetical protein
MNKYDDDRILELCSKIAVEQDHSKFLKLVEELNRVLSDKDKDNEKDKDDKEKDRRTPDNTSTNSKD